MSQKKHKHKKPVTPAVPPDPRRAPRAYHKWVLEQQIRKGKNRVVGVHGEPFHQYFNPADPTYTPALARAVQRQEWDRAKNLTRTNVNAIKTDKGLYQTTQGKQSAHEFVLRDIFYMLNIQFDYQRPHTLPNGDKIEVDFYFPKDGRYFEVFGYRGKDKSYQNQSFKKAINMSSDLWWLDLQNTYMHTNKVNLYRYATMLDHNVCHQYNCSLPLFSESVLGMLVERVPLLNENSGAKPLSLIKNYLIQMGTMGSRSKGKIRREIDRHDYLDVDEPSYWLPTNAPRDQQGALIHPLTPKASADGRVKIAQSAPTLTQITVELKSEYASAHMWTDEDKVAVYFGTPEKLQAALDSLEQQPLRMVARNWYETVKLAAAEAEQETWLHGSHEDIDDFQPDRVGSQGVIFFSRLQDFVDRKPQARYYTRPGGSVLKAVPDKARMKRFNPNTDPKAAAIMESLYPDGTRIPSDLEHWKATSGKWYDQAWPDYVPYPEVPEIVAAAKPHGYNLFKVFEPAAQNFSWAITDPSLVKVVASEKMPTDWEEWRKM